jgi:AcrR family transcriptional regulator
MAETKSARRTQANRATRRRREGKDLRPQQIVAVAFEEFAAKGFAATRLEDVAARARVSKGLPYLYFKTKEELFKAVVRSVITSHFDVMRERMEATELSVEAFLKGPFSEQGGRVAADRTRRAEAEAHLADAKQQMQRPGEIEVLEAALTQAQAMQQCPRSRSTARRNSSTSSGFPSPARRREGAARPQCGRGRRSRAAHRGRQTAEPLGPDRCRCGFGRGRAPLARAGREEPRQA